VKSEVHVEDPVRLAPPTTHSASSSGSFYSINSGDVSSGDLREQAEVEEQAHQARIDAVGKALEDLEEQYLQAKTDVDKRRLKRAIREMDRKRDDLRAAQERFRLNLQQLGEFQNQITTVQSEVRDVVTEQKALSNRQTAVEKVVEEEVAARMALEEKYVALHREVVSLKKSDANVVARVQHLEEGQAVIQEDQSSMRRGLNAINS
jgi:chromosome segregation ATPase